MSNGIRTDDIQGLIIHEYDGIEEADNRLPNWWLWTFYGAIIIGAAYWVWFEAFEIGQGPAEAYTIAKLEALDTGEEVTDDMILSIAEDSGQVKAGKKEYAKNCVTCHGASGEGKIGPNLTDEFWIHGGSAKNIYDTVLRGVNGKGMPAWGLNLGAGKSKLLAAYLVSIRDSNLPGKEPQGEKWEPPPPSEELPADAPPEDAPPADGTPADGTAKPAEGTAKPADADAPGGASE
jgi:cytochrome c oxidase cbb3-type subunit 3